MSDRERERDWQERTERQDLVLSVGRKSDGNSIELDRPPALRRSMRADLLSETNERVF